MEKQYFSLEISENNKLIRVIRIIFGVVCVVVAVFWMNFNFNLLKIDITLWITILFLTSFGLYQIWAGLGYAVRYIEIGPESVHLKKNSIFPPVQMGVVEMEKIEFLPMNVIFYLKSKKRILLRFGTTNHETNEKIVDAIMGFAESNNIPFQIIEENL